MTLSAGLRHEVDRDGVLHVVFDSPGRRVNLLSGELLEELGALLDEASRHGDVSGVVFRSAKSASFVAGMDVGQIADVDDAYRAAEGARYGQAVMQRIDDFPAPTVCAIGGTCMGGGTELALACDARIASNDPALRIGLPEVRIGIIPGFGGSQRLPRLIGLPAALDLVASGRGVDAARALRLGLVDVVVPARILDREAVALVRRLASEGTESVVTGLRRRPPLHHRLAERVAPLRARVLETARRRAARRVDPERYPAPFRAIEAVEAATRLELPQGLDHEARIVGELVPTRTCKNLIWLFGARTALRGAPERAVPRRVRRIAVVGAGGTGASIAALAAGSGVAVRLKDRDWDALLAGMRAASALWERELRRTPDAGAEIERRMARMAPTLDDTGQVHADVIVEAVGDDLAAKQRVLAGCERRVAEHAVFVTTSAAIPVGRVASHALRPERVVGLAIADASGRAPLVEIVSGPYSSPEAVATLRVWFVRLGFVPVAVNDGPGWLLGRLMMAMVDESVRLVGEGAAIEEIDRAMTSFGMERGPFAWVDRFGAGRARRLAEALHEALGDRFAGAPPGLHAVEAEGRTFYRPRSGARPAVDGAVRGLLGAPPRRETPEETLQERIVLALTNEAIRCLEEGVVGSARDVDAALVFGGGFPAFRGGPLRHADAIGVPILADRLRRLADSQGARYEPAALLDGMVREQRRFHDGSPA